MTRLPMSIDRCNRNKANKEKLIPKIVNFSDYNPTDQELSLLGKGFKFCPTPLSPDYIQLEVDINETLRKIQLRCQFSGATNTTDEQSQPIVQGKSNYIPAEIKEPFLNIFSNQLKLFAKNLYKLPKKTVYDNISKTERDAIYSLKNNTDIFLTGVDKGSTIIILNKADYIKIIEKILSDSNKYRKEDKNPNTVHLKKLKDFAKDFSGCFDTKGKEVDFILNFDIKTANFYGLPKLHKCDSVINLIKETNNFYLKTKLPSDLSFRCITAGIDSTFSKLSNLLDNVLKPLCPKVFSYIKDYTDFLNKKPKNYHENFEDLELITCDIKNMYNNLPLDLVLEAITYWLNTYPEIINNRFNSSFILKGLELVLSHSAFKFNDKHYSLLQAIATGEPVAATIATLTVGFLEVDLYKKVSLNFGPNIEFYFKKNWKRFLDDCFIIWHKSFGDFDIVFEILNNLHPMISFTKEQSDKGLSFLNLYIYIEKGFIKSDIFYKPTDTHEYLPYKSCHPRHIKNNIPSNLARMICTIVEDPSIKENRLNDLKYWLHKCGYPPNLVTSSIAKHKNENFETLRLTSEINLEEKNEILACVTTFNPKNPDIFGELLQQFKFLKNNPLYENTFRNCSLIKSQRQLPNLGRTLVKNDVAQVIKPKGSFRCLAKICDTCNFIEEVSEINFRGQTFQINRHFDCNCKNIIYKLTCNKCNEFYIGKTNNFKSRVSKHKSDIKLCEQRIIENKYVQQVSQHFNICSPQSKLNFKIVPFYEVKNATLTALLTVEDHFIRKYKPTLNG